MLQALAYSQIARGLLPEEMIATYEKTRGIMHTRRVLRGTRASAILPYTKAVLTMRSGCSKKCAAADLAAKSPDRAAISSRRWLTRTSWQGTRLPGRGGRRKGPADWQKHAGALPRGARIFDRRLAPWIRSEPLAGGQRSRPSCRRSRKPTAESSKVSDRAEERKTAATPSRY